MTVATLNFIKIYVRDLSKMVAFYSNAFGFAVYARFSNDEFDEVLLRQEGQAFLLGLLHWKDGRYEGAPSTAGVVGMVTTDMEQAVAAAMDAGAVLKQAPFAVPGSIVSFVSDPEGNEVEFVQFA